MAAKEQVRGVDIDPTYDPRTGLEGGEGDSSPYQPGGGRKVNPSDVEEKQPHGGFTKPGSFPESHYKKGTKTTRTPDKHPVRVKDHE